MGKRISILGSTGSIGTQTLDVIRDLNRDLDNRFAVVALAAGSNVDLLASQVKEFKPHLISIKKVQELQSQPQDEHHIDLLWKKLGKPSNVEILSGEDGLREAATLPEADIVINALVGAVGLEPTLAAIKAGKDVGLANKESLVIGGHLVREELAGSSAQVIPIDSEHSAIYQLLRGTDPKGVARIILTASGGALRNRELEELDRVTPGEVLNHPNWHMGSRITVDSATLVNKGFEVIEAHWLFGMPYDKIEVLVHPQSIVHGLVEFKDGTIASSLSYPDMRLPIQYALTYPERAKSSYPKLDLRGIELLFDKVDHKRYPAFKLVVEAGKVGGTLPAAMNAADEVLVERFLTEEIPFTAIAQGLREVFNGHKLVQEPAGEEIREADRRAREYVKHFGIKNG